MLALSGGKEVTLKESNFYQTFQEVTAGGWRCTCHAEPRSLAGRWGHGHLLSFHFSLVACIQFISKSGGSASQRHAETPRPPPPPWRPPGWIPPVCPNSLLTVSLTLPSHFSLFPRPQPGGLQTDSQPVALCCSGNSSRLAFL